MEENTGLVPEETGTEVDTSANAAEDTEDRAAAFEKLINGDYRDLFEKRVSSLIERRVKNLKEAETKLAAQDELMGVLKRKYDTDDAHELAAMLTEEDASEDEIISGWAAQQREAREIYPDLDMMAEALDEKSGTRFLSMLASGVNVRDAYEVIHLDELLMGVMRCTADKIREKTVNDIRSRGLRPVEGAAGYSARSVGKSTDWTEDEVNDIVKRVKKGERVIL